MTLITAWTVACRSEGCRTWSRADKKGILQIFFLGLSSVFGSQHKLHPCYSESRFFILFVSAFFLKTGMRKRSILSREAIGLLGNIVDEWLIVRYVSCKSCCSWWVVFNSDSWCRVSNRIDLGGTVPISTENPESRLDLSRDAKCPDFEKQRSCREVINQKNSLNGIFRVILW